MGFIIAVNYKLLKNSNFLIIIFQVKFTELITCYDTDEPLLNKDDICPFPLELVITLSVLVAIISLFLATFAAIYYYYNTEIKIWLYAHQFCLWLVTEKDLDRDKVYDAFISYSHKDEESIVAELISNLENGPHAYKLCLHFRNWLPGEYISKNIAKSIEESRRTIIVLSEDFLNSVWGRMEFRTAHKKALEENMTRVIIILVGEISLDNLDEELKAYLNTNTYLNWGDPWFWNKLRYALPRYRRKVMILDKADDTEIMHFTELD